MSKLVGVIGDGLLADLIYQKLSNQYEVTRYTELTTSIQQKTDLALVLDDAWYPSNHQKAEELFQTAGVPWMRGFISFGEAVLGPLVRPGIPGCSKCADYRRLMAGHDRKEMWSLQLKWEDQKEVNRDAWASRTGLLHVAYLLEAEVHKVLSSNQSHLEEQVSLINLKTFKSSHHFFLPNPMCSVCSQLPDDSPTTAQISLKPNPKTSAQNYRCRPLDELKKFLVKDYLDYRTGFLNGKMVDFVSPFTTVSVNLPLFMGNEATAGRTNSYTESELTAILEGLERYCGLASRGKKTVIKNSYANLSDQALDPTLVGVHSEHQYALPNFPFKPFHPDRPMNWVWGYCFREERPILVPELLAYYSLGCGDGFVYETSNGCALGGSLEEAIFYGMLEIVERDAFLLTWYAKLPLPRLDPYSTSDKELHMMVDRMKAVAGYDLHLFNATMENKIPSVWAIATSTNPSGFSTICAAGAHLDPIKATKSAIHELAGMMISLDDKVEKNRKKYLRMLQKPSLVQQMEDHSMLYSLPEAQERLHFLLRSDQPLRSFSDEYAHTAPNIDLTDDVKHLIQIFINLNLDVIVVNQTTSELARNNLHCVKVIIPGMLPMTFGHHLTRLTGLERVLQVPMKLGYTKIPLTPEQLNPHPHPFP